MTAAQLFTTAQHPKQESFARAVFSGDYKYLLGGGGIRGGKSAICLNILFCLCKFFPRSRWAIVRKDLPTLRRNTIPTFNKFAPRPFVGPILHDTWTATCQNGSELIFFPESLQDDPDYNRWRGLEVNGFLLEEANELSGDESTFHVAIQRAGAWIIPNGPDGRQPVQPPPLILLTCNPSPGWLKELFYDPWVNGTIASPYYFEQMLASDNPYLTPAYLDSLEELKRRDPDEYERMVGGKWIFAAGKVFGELQAGVHRVPARQRVRGLRRVVSADWGTANIAPALWSEADDALDDAPKIHVYREWGPSDMPPVRWAEGVLERSQLTDDPEDGYEIDTVILDSSCWDQAPRSWTGVVRNPGPPIAVQMAPIFRRAGVRLLPSVKGPDSVRNGIELLHTYFDTYRSVAHPEGELPPLLTIADDCPNLWKSLIQLNRGDPLKGKDRVPAPDQHPLIDYVDALRYRVQGRPLASDPDPERLKERDHIRLGEKDPMTQHEIRLAVRAGHLDPILDPEERPTPVRKPWVRPRGGRNR